jgi:hypothetical protein
MSKYLDFTEKVQFFVAGEYSSEKDVYFEEYLEPGSYLIL